jgi:molybdate transport system ATP-binding protein
MPDAGKIACDEQIFYDSEARVHVPPRERSVGYMFQDYALFPHMNVRRNIWYGVRQRSPRAEEMYRRLMELLKIEHLEKRFTADLSGGEKQRVALARALMAEPQILLLDEPLSSLDNATRLELQAELKKMQALWNIPFILVTHDPEEARAMADQIVFIDRGHRVSPPLAWPEAGLR